MELARKKMHELQKAMRSIRGTPDSYVYINLYHCILQLYAIGEYQLVINLCSTSIAAVSEFVARHR